MSHISETKTNINQQFLQPLSKIESKIQEYYYTFQFILYLYFLQFNVPIYKLILLRYNT